MNAGDGSCVELARMLSFGEFSRMQKHTSEVRFGGFSLSMLINVVPKEDGSASELNRSQYTRLPREFENSFHGSQGSELILLLKNLCRRASQSEEFFLSLSKEQWLITVLVPKSEVDDFSLSEKLSSDCFTIQCNVVPCLYWEKLQGARNDDKAAGDTSKGVYFPSSFLEKNESQLATSLKYWKATQEECRIFSGWIERFDNELIQNIDGTDMISRPLFWNIEPQDVEDSGLNDEMAGSAGNVRRMLWRGGHFARKAFKKNHKKNFLQELQVLKTIGTYPHIVYSFGVSEPMDSEDGWKYWMELMDKNLFDLIHDMHKDGDLPFSLMDSMDILLQIAKAMKYLHELKVVHGDLKSENILTRHCEVLGDVKQYVVKVADFGSAQIIQSDDESTFKLADGTTGYAAPEVVMARSKTGTRVTGSIAKRSDVYSFGIVAFEVLSGEDVEKTQADIIMVHMEACGRRYDPDLIDLIDRCLNSDPLTRPSFAEVTRELEYIIDDTKLWHS